MYWFTADTHFGHGNIIKHCNRPFMNEQEKTLFENAKKIEHKEAREQAIRNIRISPETVKLQDDTIIDNINKCVSPDDTLCILGDFCFSRDKDAWAEYRYRIHCQIIFIMGNHDDRHISYSVFEKCYDQYILRINDNGTKYAITLNHFAMMVWDRSHHSQFHLFGHTHDGLHSLPGTLSCDVGVDSWDYRPVSFAQIKDFMSKKDVTKEQGYFRHF
jgi:calcineurin-like phosphoesterase family protein